MMKLRLALMGCGFVGAGFLGLMIDKEEHLKKKYDLEVSVTSVMTRRKGVVYDPEGIDIAALIELLEEKGDFRDAPSVSEMSVEEILLNGEYDVLVEVSSSNFETGEPASGYIRSALARGKDVITTNKGPISLHYDELKSLANANQANLRFEGVVLSGTPVFNLFEGPLAGCALKSLRGIVNGTTNYILGRMELGTSYAEALKEAQALGYAETDPTNDVEGIDAAGKLAILIHILMGLDIAAEAIPRKGISDVTANEVTDSLSKGKRWKLIAEAVKEKDGGIRAKVGPEELYMNDTLSGVSGSMNAIVFDTDVAGELTIVGRGAGPKETCFALLSDLIAVRRLR